MQVHSCAPAAGAQRVLNGRLHAGLEPGGHAQHGHGTPVRQDRARRRRRLVHAGDEGAAAGISVPLVPQIVHAPTRTCMHA